MSSSLTNSPVTFLDQINSPLDLKKIAPENLPSLATEIREFIIQTVNKNGGHLASSLGVVELTIALHYVFDSPQNGIIWDVGHQSAPHKILTDRRVKFSTFKKENGLSSFPTRIESEHDLFGTGHSSTALSASIGIATAKRLKNQNDLTIAVVGDASLMGGLSLEALNHLGDLQENVLLILNQNDMSIDQQQGAVGKNQNYQELLSSFNLVLENQGQAIDGHDLSALISTLTQIKNKAEQNPTARALIIKTTKGQGFEPAVQDPTEFHGVKPGFLDKTTPSSKKSNLTIATSSASSSSPKTTNPTSKSLQIDWSDVAGETLNYLMQEDSQVIVICPAMASRSGLTSVMTNFPDRFFDPGIVEQHTLTFASGLATQGFKPYIVISSSFLQRAYDQLVHDIALQKLPVRLLVDRTGESCDGPTHHGNLDLQYLSSVPHLQVIAPSNSRQLAISIGQSINQHLPLAIRFPKIKVDLDEDWHRHFKITSQLLAQKLTPLAKRKTILNRPKGHQKIAMVNLGKIQSHTVLTQIQVWRNKLEKDLTINQIDLFDCQYLRPVPEKEFQDLILPHYDQIITAEDGIVSGGGFGAKVSQIGFKNNFPGKIVNLGL